LVQKNRIGVPLDSLAIAGPQPAAQRKIRARADKITDQEFDFRKVDPPARRAPSRDTAMMS
jgi:hypothetical protein